MNDSIFLFFYSLAHQSQFFDKVIIFFSVYFPFVVACSVGLFLILQKKWKESILIFSSGFLAYFISAALKILFHTPRPYLALPNVHALFPEAGYAFPSSHAAFFMALAVSLFFYHKKAGYVFILFALLIGLARIAAGVHFPVDILGGFVLGSFVGALVAYFVKNTFRF